ncbi:MAG: hypothetical protein AB7E60_09065 [Sphingobium sp.]
MAKLTFDGRRYAGLAALVIGLVLTGAATCTIFLAPEGASVTMQNRTGRRQFEVGLWALYIAPFLCFFLSRYALRPVVEAGTRRPGLMVLLMTAVATGWQWSMISAIFHR